ncbi:hypothetical protein [Heterosigma akashiwo virus 01]|uniref:Uncharacterized protein n=1 Tax=Heterosigma akashiwo virus 01 TaxID=97195 RepID=A0A1C9C5K7_HAV01|nr:hypothetical protein D1R72_gp239 [Heterosigma akashiwo virus 01]AOM63570.1 hypothetical protein [Heterosigma akashiwo virus 01]
MKTILLNEYFYDIVINVILNAIFVSNNYFFFLMCAMFSTYGNDLGKMIHDMNNVKNEYNKVSSSVIRFIHVSLILFSISFVVGLNSNFNRLMTNRLFNEYVSLYTYKPFLNIPINMFLYGIILGVLMSLPCTKECFINIISKITGTLLLIPILLCGVLLGNAYKRPGFESNEYFSLKLKKVGRGLKKGAKIAAKGAKKGAKIAAKGAKKGAKIAAKGDKKGAKIAAKGDKKGAKIAAKGDRRGAKIAAKGARLGEKKTGLMGKHKRKTEPRQKSKPMPKTEQQKMSQARVGEIAGSSSIRYDQDLNIIINTGGGGHRRDCNQYRRSPMEIRLPKPTKNDDKDTDYNFNFNSKDDIIFNNNKFGETFTNENTPDETKRVLLVYIKNMMMSWITLLFSLFFSSYIVKSFYVFKVSK